MEIYNGEHNDPHPDTGWRLDSVWSDQQTTGDYTVGQEFICYYSAPGHPYIAELTYYVTGQYLETGDHGWQDLLAGTELPEGILVRYAWDERCEFFGSAESRKGGPDDVDYDRGSVSFFATVEEADEAARREALTDVSWVFAHPDTLNERSAA